MRIYNSRILGEGLIDKQGHVSERFVEDLDELLEKFIVERPMRTNEVDDRLAANDAILLVVYSEKVQHARDKWLNLISPNLDHGNSVQYLKECTPERILQTVSLERRLAGS